MYKLSVLVLVIMLFIVACHRKTAPLVADRTSLPPAPVTALATAYSAADIEAGKIIYTSGKCAKCHAAKPVENWTVDGWKPILKSMIPKAKLDSIQKLQVTAYVNTFAKKP